MSYQTPLLVVLLPLAIAIAGCGEAPSPPTSPGTVGLVEGPGAYPDGSTLKTTAPTPLSPVGGEEVDDDDPDLVIENSRGKFTDGLALSYVFEVFGADNGLVYRSDPVAAGTGGQTAHEIGVGLEFDKPFTWRAYATYQGRRGPASSPAAFKTYNRYGVSCAHLGTELEIVRCRRAQFGFLSIRQRVEYLRRIAYDLNRAPAEHAPYGILKKSTGNNCFGYACDIICSDQGRHRQWDVLGDEDERQVPVWSRVDPAAVRPCEVIQ